MAAREHVPVVLHRSREVLVAPIQVHESLEIRVRADHVSHLELRAAVRDLKVRRVGN